MNYELPTVALTVTALQSVAAAQNLDIGFATDGVTNTGGGELYDDFIISGQFTVNASNRQPGVIHVYAFGALTGAPLWPDLFSSGTEGTNGTAALHDTEERDSGLVLVASIIVDAAGNQVYAFPPTSLKRAFGLDYPPMAFGLFVTTNATTTTTAALASSGNALYYTPVRN
jgi:hypothetical protein